ncbi:RTA1 like protein-domain-containing protein [Mycena albidolilacea]|uniref:RTA1 like protein-domain-containing protein n=1 Tax=Mycena albidolilacea TaxID=1033008 RepID=A0AAD7A669_9AGAR|nr:RTA1 like protein-domain-containing protein [Mycena albidolilacea]
MSRLFILLFTACFTTVLAAGAADQTTEDANNIPGGFIPKKSLSYIGIIAYGLSGLIHWFHFFTVPPRRTFMATLPIGMTAMAIGFILRIIYANPPFSLGEYVIMDLVILLSPCLYLATDYMLLSNLAKSFDDDVANRCLLIRHSRITKIFVWSDVFTFLLQSGGGGLTAMDNVKLANLGSTIGLIGLILQAASFGLFTVILIVFAWRISTHYPELWCPQSPRPFRVLSRQPIDDWRILVYIMLVTCVGILIRSIFRIAEFAGGYSGTVATHEAYFYTFDALPLWIVMSLYCVVWPARALMERRSGILELGSRQELNPGKPYSFA